MMIRALAILLFAAIASVTWAQADAPAFDTFKIFTDRNIFNSKRAADTSGSSRKVAVKADPNRLSLLGVLLDGKEAVAFFEGSRAEYTSSVSLGDTIAGQRLIEVRTDRVRLASSGKTTELPVGYQMTQNDDKSWTVSGAAEVTAETTSATKTADAGTSSSAAAVAPPPGVSNDVIKRLMERRKKEMGE